MAGKNRIWYMDLNEGAIDYQFVISKDTDNTLKRHL